MRAQRVGGFMKRIILCAVAIWALAIAWQPVVDAGGARGRREAPAIGVAPVPPGAHGRRPVVRTYVYPYPYAPYGYYYPYGPQSLVVTPYGSYYLPPTVVVTQPYYCILHQSGWVSRAGFLDHVAGTHKLPLESAAAFCPDGVEACLFPAY